jgi:hypothetical protein
MPCAVTESQKYFSGLRDRRSLAANLEPASDFKP